MRLKLLLISIIIFSLNFELSSQGCSMCKSIVQSEISAGNEGISSGINFGIIYLFTSTYLLLTAGGLLWYFRSKKDQKNLEIRNKISKRIASIHS
tara:strand:- start:1045 stop:1329 length:285 start_codon:yes stop_codon:yes gene_type:complete